MDRWSGAVAVVTGASAGIGAAIVEQLVEYGLKVAGLARRLDKLEVLARKLSNAPGNLYPVKCDVTQEEQILNAFQWIKSNLGPVSILINNAGVLQNTTLCDGDTKMWKTIFDTNVMGLCICTREAIKAMKENNVSGHIVNINSVAGHNVPSFDYMNVYPASKFAVTALSESFRIELRKVKSKIKLSSVSPGAVETEILEASNIDLKDHELLQHFQWLKPKEVADAVIYVLSTPENVQVKELIIAPLHEGF